MRFALALSGIVLCSACATPTLYSWGRYEDLVYQSYAKPDAVPPEKQIEMLEEDFQKARSENHAVPPGWHAHLGYLYFQIGKFDQAKQEFETEKADFPESAVYVDRLLAKFEKVEKR